MAAPCGLVTFAIDTAKTAGQTQDVTGFGNGATSIKWFLVFATGLITAVDAVDGSGPPFVCIGFCDGTNQRCMQQCDQDGAGTSAASRGNRNDAILSVFNSATQADSGRLAFGSFITDGIRFSYTTQFAVASTSNPGAIRVAVLAGWGDAVPEVGSVTLNASTGNQTITLANGALNPQLVFLMHQGNNANTANTGGVLGLGMFDGAGNQGAITNVWQDNQANAVNKKYCYTGECLATINASAALSHRWSYVSSTTGSFVINRLEGTSADVMYYLAIGGISCLVGNTTTETDTTSVRTLTLGHTPRAGIFLSHGTTVSTQDTLQANAHVSVGGFSWDGTTLVQHAQAANGEDGNTTMNDHRSVEFDNVQITINATGTSNDGTMRVKQVTTTSGGQVELDNNQNADAANNLVLFALIGDQAAAPSLWGGLRADTWNRLVQTV